MDVIPVAARSGNCPDCGLPVNLLTTNGITYLLEDAVHGLTERFDRRGMITAYDHLPVWPAHSCNPLTQ